MNRLLAQPLTFSGLTLSSRLVMPPMASGKPSPDGSVSDSLLAYYAEKARGGYLGMVITEHAFVSPEGKAHEGQLSIARDEDIPGLRELAKLLHENGVKAFAQISHAGGATGQAVTGLAPISASAVKSPKARPDAETPREMTAEEIAKTVLAFRDAARRAKEAGFDGVEIHSAHSYLLNQFYSPLTNRRTDNYTGSTLEGRLRIHLEIIHSIREAVGEGYPIALRLGAIDDLPGGTTLEDSVRAAGILQAAGIDLLDISGGFCGPYRPEHKEQGYFGKLAEAIKKEVTVPVLLTGGITDPEAAERLLEEGKADLIGVGRALLKDSDWAKKALEKI